MPLLPAGSDGLETASRALLGERKVVMPRLTRGIPKLSRQGNQAIVRIDGQKHYLGTWNSKPAKQNYDRIVGEWIARGRKLPAADDAEITIAELIRDFWRHAKQHYLKDGVPTSELGSYQAVFKNYLRPRYGRMPAAEFSPLALKACRQAMIDAGLSRKTINGYVFRIRYMFKWAVSEELVSVHVYQALAIVAGLQQGRSRAKEGRARGPVPEAEIAAVETEVSQEVADLIDLQLLTAARSGELLGVPGRPASALATGDLDMTGRTWTARIGAHKTVHHGKDRMLFFGPKAQLILRRYVKADPRAKLFSYERYSYCRAITRACERVFPPPVHLAQRDKESRRAWVQRLTDRQREELREWNRTHRWTPHWLRHSAGTYIRQEFGVEAAQIILGHSRLSTTELYAAKNVTRAMEIMEQVG